MASGQNTLWDRFLQPLFSLAIDEKELKELSDSIDWEQECDRLKSSSLVYPEYYTSIQNYAEGNVDAWLGAAGFDLVRTEDVWWTNQLSTAVKSVSI